MSDVADIAARSGATDFDFLHGNWRVKHRRLAARLVASNNWQEFEGAMSAVSILGGLGNFDQNTIGLPEGAYEACTVRLYDPTRATWSIHWIDGRDPKFDAPLIGGFCGGVGEFYGAGEVGEKPISVRFIWSVIAPSLARWEQAFSEDDGNNWETNWVMNFERRGDLS